MSGPPALRTATRADVETLDDIVVATEPPSSEPPTPAGAQVPYLAHLVARGRVLVAQGEDGIVGFGATVDTGRSIHLADLFVLPGEQGRGIGGRLVVALFADAGPRRTTFASDDPRALPLYVRLGMRPLWPNLYVAGDPGQLPAPPADHSIETVSLATMAGLERRWSGVERAPDLGYWGTAPDAMPFAVVVRGAPVAVGLRRRRMRTPDLWLDHVRVSQEADPLPALLAAFRFGAGLGRLTGGCVPGPSPVLAALMDAGFRVFDHDTFMASAVDLVDPEREVVNTGIL